MYLTLKTENIENIPKAEEFMTSFADTPTSWDWRDHGAVTGVKN